MDGLEGIRVLDLTHYVAGPFCTLMMGDAGADVVKLEPPTGDRVRNFPSSFSGESRLFLGLNRSKRSLALNLKTQQGRRYRPKTRRADGRVRGGLPTRRGREVRAGRGRPDARKPPAHLSLGLRLRAGRSPCASGAASTPSSRRRRAFPPSRAGAARRSSYRVLSSTT